MADLKQLEFFLLRYVPDAVKDEFVNIGVVMLEPGANGEGFADARFTRDWRRVRCVDPQADVDVLESLEREIREQLAKTRDHGLLFKKIQDSFSNLIQLSSAKGCLAEDPANEIAVLAAIYLEGGGSGLKREAGGRQKIVTQMREAFERAGVWKLLMTNIPVAQYTRPGDPLKLDFGYRVGDEIKLFHAVSLRAGVEQAVILAARYPRIFAGMRKKNDRVASLTAVVENDWNRKQESVQFALGMMEEEKIRVASVSEMALIAERARLELRA